MQNYVKTIEYMVKQNTNAKIPKECRDIIFLVIFQFVNHLFTLARHYSHLQNPERPRRPHARGADLQRVVDPGCFGRLGDLGLLDGLTNEHDHEKEQPEHDKRDEKAQRRTVPARASTVKSTAAAADPHPPLWADLWLCLTARALWRGLLQLYPTRPWEVRLRHPAV